ncbi:MAG: hypothetical protein IKP12_06725 [Acholeplasmatales bacterium]|nr:hypothetical protein [Acholeplasmatales bacterium]
MERVVYKKSFAAKMILAQNESINVYQELKEACAKRKGISNRLSFEKETIKFGRVKVGMMKIARKNISLYLAIDPKTLENSKYKFEDVSDKKSYVDYPTKLNLKSKRSVKYAIELLDSLFNKFDAKEQELKEVDYKAQFYYRDFDELLRQGFIKKYVYRKIDNKTVLVEEKVKEYNVCFKAKLLYCATNEAEDLYIITNQTNWDPKKATKMVRVETNLFEANMKFAEGTKLEFKICRSDSFADVEKGIWKEEIVNHHYVINQDLEIEDLIHNFRIN